MPNREEPENNLSEEQQGFADFIRDIRIEDLARVYKSYSFLAQFGAAVDVWKRDACRSELLTRDPERLALIEASTAAGFGGLTPEQER